MRHHITVLQGLCREGDLEEARTYLETLSRRPELSRSSGCTVHPAVDAVLTALLMNLLENALETNEKAPEGADK